MIKNILLISIFIVLVSSNLKAKNDTLYLKKDSSIVIVYNQDSANSIYFVSVYDKRKDIILYEMPRMAANSRLIRKTNNLYHIVVEAYYPVYGKSSWKKYELVRYILWINGNKHSFFNSYAYVNYPKLTDAQLLQILKESEDIHTNSFFKVQNKNDCYVRNIGLLGIGILNGNSDCLKRFNEVGNMCTGGEGCEIYSAIQKELSYTDYELCVRKQAGSYFPYYLKKKIHPNKNQNH